jgi:hypothetical protein
MASTPKSRATYQSQSTAANGSNLFRAKQICLIVGLTCLAGFSVDMLVLGLPPSPFTLQWRVGFLQQVGDRSIVLLFGISLMLYSLLGNRRLTKRLSLICLGVGVAFILSCILIIRDSLILQDQTIRNISTQAQQLQTQIEESRDRPELPAEITPERFAQATQQVTSQAEQLKQNARAGITKVGLASIGNLVVVGLGLIGLGRFGLTTARYLTRE